MTTTPAAERVRSAGLRVTGPRVAVLEALAAAGSARPPGEGRHPDHHLTAADVAAAARARLGSLSTQAVYDCLDALVRVGLARRIEPAGHPALYEARAGDHHHHLVCRACGATADVDCVHGAAPCLTPAGTTGFVVDEAEIIFWGWCAACAPDRQQTEPEQSEPEQTEHTPTERTP